MAGRPAESTGIPRPAGGTRDVMENNGNFLDYSAE
jgi:hypothetical protein